MNSPYTATKFSDACRHFVDLPAGNPPQSEDCLYLNVYVPRKVNQTMALAVMVYFHGGGFDWGSGNIFDGKYLAAYGNVIVVTLNYRLGLFGFLRLDDIHAPGNLGLWDQRMALQWINRNINSFGGDKAKVTLFGNSVGGMSAVIHALYPENKGLFQRVITQSGSVSMLGYNMNLENTPEVEHVVKLLGCSAESVLDILDCLRKIPALNFTSDVKELSLEAKKAMMRSQFYVPNFDGTLINWNPRDLWRTDDEKVTNSVESFRSIDFLNGFNEFESAAVLPLLFNISDPEQFLPSKEEMKAGIEAALKMSFDKATVDSLTIQAFVMSEYTNWRDSGPYGPESIRLEVVRLYTDMLYAVPAIQLSQIHARNSNSSGNNFLYVFSANPTFHVLKRPSWIHGASHGDEMLFLAGIDRIPVVKQWEKELSYKLIKYWSNFAKYGNPNEAPELNDLPNWGTYELKNQEYIDLNTNITIKGFPNARATDFWLNLIPVLVSSEQTEKPGCITSIAASPSHVFGQALLVSFSLLLM